VSPTPVASAAAAAPSDVAEVAASVGPVDGDYASWNELDSDNDWVQYDVFIIGRRVK
jgi:hypothetical protein